MGFFSETGVLLPAGFEAVDCRLCTFCGRFFAWWRFRLLQQFLLHNGLRDGLRIGFGVFASRITLDGSSKETSS